METRAAARPTTPGFAGHDFPVERGVCGMPPPSHATFGRGKGPTIALLAEYDALPGQGNRGGAVPGARRDARGPRLRPQPARPGPGGRGHRGAERDRGERAGGAAVVVLGCPAEELLWGKLALLDRGAFAGSDALLTSHARLPERRALAPVPGVRLERARVHGRREPRRGRPPSQCAPGAGAGDARDRRPAERPAPGLRRRTRGAGRRASCRASRPDEARLWVTVRHESFEAARDAWGEIAGLAAGGGPGRRASPSETS